MPLEGMVPSSHSLLGKGCAAPCVSRPGYDLHTVILLSQVHAYSLRLALAPGIQPTSICHHVVRRVQYGLVLLFNFLDQLLVQGVPVSEEFVPVCSHHAVVEVVFNVRVLKRDRIIVEMSNGQPGREEFSLVEGLVEIMCLFLARLDHFHA